MSYRILITDGQNKNSLSLVRNLGKENCVDITSPYSRAYTLSGYSKYVNKIYPYTRAEEYEKLQKILSNKNGKYDLFIPVSLHSYLLASKHKKEILEKTNALIPDWKEMEVAYNKNKTVSFAEKIGIPVPKSVELTDDKLKDITNFPVVIKSSDDSGKYVKYNNNYKELKVNYQKLKKISKTKIIAQEYIDGFGAGFYSVCRKGKMYAAFMHKRLKEFPITGGPSAVAKSYRNIKLFEYGKKICENLNWTGPMMIEFKYSIKKDDFFLIEINPKLWGSLDLTISAGVNIPKVIMKLALDEDIQAINTYTDVRFKNVKYRWIFPDEFKVLLSRGESLHEFLYLGDKNTYTNLNLEDPIPTIFQILNGFREGFKVLVDVNSRFPHGVIEK